MGNRRFWGRVWEQTPQHRHCVAVSVSRGHVNALRGTSAQEALSNQVDEMTHSVNVSQPLSAATPVLLQWACEAVIGEMN